jgi:hypothetical protein
MCQASSPPPSPMVVDLAFYLLRGVDIGAMRLL